MNEEVIRNVLTCVERRKLQKNYDTGVMERDGKVFTDAARYLGYYGEGWIKLGGKENYRVIVDIIRIIFQISMTGPQGNINLYTRPH